MKTIILITSLIIFLFLGFISNSSAQTITINFQNIDVKKGGYLYISLYNSDKGYPHLDNAYKTIYIPVGKKEMKVSFENIKPGIYAINVFHDENSNKKMETNFIGIPAEGYGLSNNPRLFGPPTFNKTKFELKGASLSLDISINY